jgi:hypothetical protein
VFWDVMQFSLMDGANVSEEPAASNFDIEKRQQLLLKS